MAQWLTTQLGSMRTQVQSLASLSGLEIWLCCELWCRSQMWLRSSIAALWYRPAVLAPIRPLAWQLPYATDVALKKKKKKKKKNTMQFFVGSRTVRQISKTDLCLHWCGALCLHWWQNSYCHLFSTLTKKSKIEFKCENNQIGIVTIPYNTTYPKQEFPSWCNG